MAEGDHTFDVLLKEIRKEMNEVSDIILTSRLDMEEYRRLQGMIEGLARVERMVLDLEEKQHESD